MAGNEPCVIPTQKSSLHFGTPFPKVQAAFSFAARLFVQFNVQPLHQRGERVGRIEMQHDFAFFAVARFDFRAHAQSLGQSFRQACDVGVDFGGGLHAFALLRQLAAAFGFSHRPAVFHCFLRQIQLFVHRQVDECARVSHFQVALEQHLLHRLG